MITFLFVLCVLNCFFTYYTLSQLIKFEEKGIDFLFDNSEEVSYAKKDS